LLSFISTFLRVPSSLLLLFLYFLLTLAAFLHGAARGPSCAPPPEQGERPEPEPEPEPRVCSGTQISWFWTKAACFLAHRTTDLTPFLSCCSGIMRGAGAQKIFAARSARAAAKILPPATR
jgi:hypothetical protein